MVAAYSQRFVDAAEVHSYETVVYSPDSYSAAIWKLQQPVVQSLIQQHVAERPHSSLLDFACGSGRILSSVEHLTESTTGVDISPTMVEVARRKCRRSRLVVGDLATSPDLVQGPFDVITMFRLLLNVEPPVRRTVLQTLRNYLKPDGILIANVHGNSRSLRHPAIRYKRWREGLKPHERSEQLLEEMSPGETRDLFRECGFSVMRQLGTGVVPPTLYRSPLRPVARWLDRWASGRPLFQNVSIDLLYVCRRSDE